MRPPALLFVFCLALFPAAGFGAPATAAVIAEVQAALDNGDAQHAANLADTALKDGMSAAERGRLLLYRGLAEEPMGKHGDAMVDFSSALETRALPAEEREQAQLQRGFLRDGLGELDAAVSDYSAVIAMKGASLSTALTDRANIQRRQNRLLDARRDYLAALSAGGGRPQYAWYGLGQIAEAQHDTAAARGFYAKALVADAGYGDAQDRLTALGGIPDDIVAGAAPIVLHPPGAVRATAAAVVLHPPGTQRAARRHANAPAAADLRGSLVLRPALDAAARSAATMEPAKGQVQLGAWRSEGRGAGRLGQCQTAGGHGSG